MTIKLKTALIATVLMISGASSAKVIEMRSTLNSPNITGNVTVIPMDNIVEMSKFKLSYDPTYQLINNEYPNARHVIQRLPFADQAKINMFVHDARIEKVLTPNTIPTGGATLLRIVENSSHDTSNLKNIQDYNDFVRHGYTEKLNKLVSVDVVLKDHNLITVQVQNRTDLPLKAVTFNLRAVDESNGRVYLDQMITEKVSVKPMHQDNYKIYMALKPEPWMNMNDGLIFKAVVTEIKYGKNQIFNADDFYKQTNNSAQK